MRTLLDAAGPLDAIYISNHGAMVSTADSDPDGELYALDNICTHQFAVLSEGYVEDGCIECPLHQGRFSLATGAPLAPPVTEPVRVYPVRTEAGKVYVELPD